MSSIAAELIELERKAILQKVQRLRRAAQNVGQSTYLVVLERWIKARSKPAKKGKQ